MTWKTSLFASFALVQFVSEISASPPFSAAPVVPIVTAGYSVRPSQFVVWNDALYFSSIDPLKGVELWKYDGIAAAAVTDINPGIGFSSPQDPIVFQNSLYFTATDGAHGRELWKYDGQNATMVQDFVPGSGSPSISKGAVYNNELYFAAFSAATGRELYKTDGTHISLAADIRSGSPASINYPPELTVFNGTLYFKASLDDSRYKLYQLNGSQATLANQLDLETPYAQFTPYRGVLAELPDLSKNIYLFDGNQATPIVTSTNVENFGQLSPLGATELVFLGHNFNGIELFHFDGQTISLLKDFTPGIANTDFGEFALAGGRMFIVARAGPPLGNWTIYTYDGQTIEPVPGATNIQFPSGLTELGDTLYFTAQKGDDFWLYRIEGVPEPVSVALLIPAIAFLASSTFICRPNKPRRPTNFQKTL